MVLFPPQVERLAFAYVDVSKLRKMGPADEVYAERAGRGGATGPRRFKSALELTLLVRRTQNDAKMNMERRAEAEEK